MSANPTVETHPLLFAVVQQHLAYYYEAEERVTKAYILADLRKDSQFSEMLAEAGLQLDHENTLRAFRQIYWYVVREYMNRRTGWIARSTGTNSVFFHKDWGTPEELRDAINIRIRDRERDQAALAEIVQITETRCGQLGWSFDAQYDDTGELVHVDVWKYAA